MRKVKQLICFFILLLANILLLAHTVLPHSHHDGTICFSHSNTLSQTCATDNSPHNTDCCDKHHDERISDHHHLTLDDCDLKDFILRQGDDSHNDIVPCESCLALMYTIYSLNELYLLAPEYEKQQNAKPYLNNYTPPCVGSIHGLRGPPVSNFLG